MSNAKRVNFEFMSRARDIKKRGREATKEERMQILRDITLEQETLKNDWDENEKENNRATVEQRIEDTKNTEK